MTLNAEKASSADAGEIFCIIKESKKIEYASYGMEIVYIFEVNKDIEFLT